MDVFAVRDYKEFTESFVDVADPRIAAYLAERAAGDRQWPEPWVSLNPRFASGETVADLVEEGLLHPECDRIFRVGRRGPGDSGQPLRLYRHQREAIELARQQKRSYILTTGTGSGKSLAYIIPIVDEVLRTAQLSAGPRRGVTAIVVYPMNALANSQLGELEKFVGGAYPYVVRQKVGGTHATYSYINQLPVPTRTVTCDGCSWCSSTSFSDWIAGRVDALVYTAWDMGPFALDIAEDGPPFVWDGGRRALVRAELDAAFFHLYGVARDDVDYIVGTFPIVRRKDEAKYGEYRTKRLILQVYDAMRHVTDTGVPYQTILDPPPGYGPRQRTDPDMPSALASLGGDQ